VGRQLVGEAHALKLAGQEGSLRISGGTIEMSRNAVSERLLGMPREARRDNDVAFRDVPRSAPSR